MYNPSKPIVVRRVPAAFSFKSSNMSGLRHEGDDQVMLLQHDKSCNNNKGGYKLEGSCSSNNGVVLQGKSSALVLPRGGHGSCRCSSSDGGNEQVEALQKEYSGRERLKRHREEVAGRVLIPDKWGKEESLKDWIDYSSFDSLLAPNGHASARKALMAEGRTTTGSRRLTRIGSMC